MTHHAYISLGSNTGDRRHYLQLALDLLARNPRNRLVKVSSVYLTEALTLDGQPGSEFLNAVCHLRTNLLLRELFREMQEIESRLGRIRHNRWSERTIDIDLLTFSDYCVDDAKLTIPHPGLREREFVLRPIAEIAPNWCHPVSGESIHDLLKSLEHSHRMGRVLSCCGSLRS